MLVLPEYAVDLCVEHLIIASFILFIVLNFCHQYVFTPFIFIPFCKACIGVKGEEFACKKDKKLVYDVWPHWAGKCIYGLLMFIMWYNYGEQYPEYKNYQNWIVYCGTQLSPDHPEKRAGAPLWAIYFAYTYWECWKDLLKPKKQGKKYNPMLFMFDFHHIITVYFSYLAYQVGLMRGGFVTRLIFDFGSVVLYYAKCFEAIHKIRTGKQTDLICQITMSMVSLTWLVTRVIMFGYFNYCSVMTYFYPLLNVYCSPFNQKVCVTCNNILWIMQVIWMIGIFKINLKYFGDGDTSDNLHYEPDEDKDKKIE